MTDEPGADELRRRLRALERRLRREKLALERRNPLEDPEAYTEGFEALVELEAARRDLRAALGSEGEDDTDGSEEEADVPEDPDPA